MNYIYESPDGGKTVYRRPANDPYAKRELCCSENEIHNSLMNSELDLGHGIIVKIKP